MRLDRSGSTRKLPVQAFRTHRRTFRAKETPFASSSNACITTFRISCIFFRRIPLFDSSLLEYKSSRLLGLIDLRIVPLPGIWTTIETGPNIWLTRKHTSEGHLQKDTSTKSKEATGRRHDRDISLLRGRSSPDGSFTSTLRNSERQRRWRDFGRQIPNAGRAGQWLLWRRLQSHRERHGRNRCHKTCMSPTPFEVITTS